MAAPTAQATSGRAWIEGLPSDYVVSAVGKTRTVPLRLHNDTDQPLILSQLTDLPGVAAAAGEQITVTDPLCATGYTGKLSAVVRRA